MNVPSENRVDYRSFVVELPRVIRGGRLWLLHNFSDRSCNRSRGTTGIVDCQSHLFFPEVIDLMRKDN